MSYEDLMARIARELPELAGKLSAPRVTYVKSLQKTYITFESTVLAGENQFLKLEKVLREICAFVPTLGWRVNGLDYSPIRGPEGNIEFLLDIVRGENVTANGREISVDVTIDRAYDNFFILTNRVL